MIFNLYNYLPILAQMFEHINYYRDDETESLRFTTTDGLKLDLYYTEDLVEGGDDCYIVQDDLEGLQGSIKGIMSLLEAYIEHEKEVYLEEVIKKYDRKTS